LIEKGKVAYYIFAKGEFMKSVNRVFIFTPIIFLLSLLSMISGCGGGGDGKSGNPAQIPSIWHLRAALPSSKTFNKVTYTNTFMALGNGTIVTSPNGTTWTSRDVGTNADNFYGATYGNDTFVAVGFIYSSPLSVLPPDTSIFYSPNGVEWTSINASLSYVLNAVTYGNGIFVAVGGLGVILTSSDGREWTLRNSGIDSYLYDVTYSNGIFTAVGEAGTILSSSDGVTWISRNSGVTSAYLHGVIYANCNYVVVGNDIDTSVVILTSPDGATWIRKVSGMADTTELVGVAFGKGIFVVAGNDYSGATSLFTSSDGTRWTKTSGPAIGLSGITYGKDTFVVTGFDYGTSQSVILQSDPVR
jgi:hypothetical protein